MGRLYRNSATSLILLLWAFIFLFVPIRVSGHEQMNADAPEIGLDEHLGAKIPLDTTFSDETGRTVRLSELVTGPTIILPVCGIL